MELQTVKALLAEAALRKIVTSSHCMPKAARTSGGFRVYPPQALERLRFVKRAAVANLCVRYLPYGELERHRESMARFGQGLKAIQAVSRVLE